MSRKFLGFQSDFSCGSLMNLVRRTLSHYFLFFTDDVQTVIFPAILQKLKNLTAEINRKMSSERSISDDIFTN